MARPKLLGDEEYMIREDEHINQLKVEYVIQLANLLHSVCDWRDVADKLGLSREEQRAIEAGPGVVVDPTQPAVRHIQTVDVLLQWCKKDYSTVHVLRQLLREVAPELVLELDHHRRMLVTLHLDIKRDAREGELQSFNCPARKPLINVVRPMLHRTLPPTSVTRGDRVLVKLDITGASDDIVWTSQAQKFVGREWTITYKTLHLPVKSSQTGPRCRDPNVFDVPQRNAVTWQDDDAFIFHYIGVGEDSSSPASNKSLSFDDDDEIVYENRTDSPETETTATVSVEPRPLTFSPLLDAAHDTTVVHPQSGDDESDI